MTTGPLDLPLTEDFRVGAIALAWDHDGERVIIEAQEESEEPLEPLADDVPDDGPAILRVRITADARARVLPARDPGRAARAGRRARCAGCRSTRPATCARGRTATGSGMPDAAPQPGCRGGRTSGRAGGAAAVSEQIAAARATRPRRWTCSPRHPRRQGPARRRVERHDVLHDQRRRRRQLPASTSPSPASGRSGTSPTARWPGASWPPTSCRGRRAGTWCRRPCTGTARSAPACASCGSTPTPSVDLVELARSNDDRLRQMAVFDAVVNNADRKIGHLLPDRRRPPVRLRSRGLLRPEYKLRTVLWQWRGKRLHERGAGHAAGWRPARARRPGCRAQRLADRRPRSRRPSGGSS